MTFLARPADGCRPPQPLREHLLAAASLTERFATQLGLGSDARYTGQIHDLGKYRQAFQQYIAGRRDGDPDTWHAAIGASKAAQDKALSSAFAIAGHHAGLHDLADLQELIRQARGKLTPELLRDAESDTGPLKYVPASPLAGLSCSNEDRLIGEFATRMLFSALVDADRLDAAFWPDQHPVGRALDTVAMLDALERTVATRRKPDSPLQAARDMVFHACLTAGSGPQGFYALTVPTGGGKTLSAMAFALEHARAHDLSRVIVVIPYLSIIEQNAAEYTRVFGPDAILECHSSVEGGTTDETPTRDLWTENWDAPVIVTTSVQFLESLLAASPAKCRKLHRIARSVVIFDEVQSMPAHLLHPCLNVFRELAARYKTSFLFCTATPPAFRASGNLPDGFTAGELRPVLSDAPKLYRSLRRVLYHLPRDGEAITWPSLAATLHEKDQVLCVVNLVRHARDLWAEMRRLAEEQRSVHRPFHLSAAMCAQHRFDKLAAIRLLLRHGAPCRVVSTQLVEAGADIDFPEVWRAFGPLDAIVQAAGRCNREGRAEQGHVHVFRPEDGGLPGGLYAQATDLAAIEIDGISRTGNPDDSLAAEPDLFGRYFDALYGTADVGADIQEMRLALRFRSVADEAKVIQDGGQPVVVPYGLGPRLLDTLRGKLVRHAPAPEIRAGFRALQRYMVNVHPRDYGVWLSAGHIAPPWPGAPVLALKEGLYHDDLGILVEGRAPEDLIA